MTCLKVLCKLTFAVLITLAIYIHVLISYMRVCFCVKLIINLTYVME